jgi:cytochrome P450
MAFFDQIFGTVDHELHRIRRSALNPFFSKRSVKELAPFIQNIVDALCARFDDAVQTGEPINLGFAYEALTLDVMNEFCFSRSGNTVLMPDFNQRSFEDLQVYLEMGLLVGSFERLTGT